MSSEFDVLEEEPPKDHTKWVWLGILIAIGLMVLALWAAGRQTFGGQSIVRAKHILIQFDPRDPADRGSALEFIAELRQRIIDGESFSKLAREFSADSYSSARGGELGYQIKGAFDDAFEEYVWEAPVGVLSDVVTTSHGLHLIVVLDRQLSKADAYHKRLLEQTIEKDTMPLSEGAPQTP